MVSNTETVNVNQYVSSPPANASSSPGAMGRLRQTLQQAQESVSNRLQAAKPQTQVNVTQLPTIQQPETPTMTYSDSRNSQTPTTEFKEIPELP